MHKIVGKVSEEEKLEIESIFNTKRGLEELFASLISNKTDTNNSSLYNRLMKDYIEVTAKFHKWWEVKSQAYGWENIEGRSWSIDFEKNEIGLS